MPTVTPNLTGTEAIAAYRQAAIFAEEAKIAASVAKGAAFRILREEFRQRAYEAGSEADVSALTDRPPRKIVGGIQQAGDGDLLALGIPCEHCLTIVTGHRQGHTVIGRTPEANFVPDGLPYVTCRGLR
jgi:hypothetical protein